MKHTNIFSKRAARKLLVMGLLFVPLAYFSDCLLDALLFEEGSFWEQVTQPNTHEITIRILFSTFILGVTWYGCHLLKILGFRETAANQTIENLQKSKQDLEAINHALTMDIRNMVTSVKAKTDLIIELKEKMDPKTLYSTISSMDHTLSQAEAVLDDLHYITKP